MELAARLAAEPGAGRARAGLHGRRGGGPARRRRRSTLESLRSPFGFVLDHATPDRRGDRRRADLQAAGRRVRGVEAHAGIRPEDGPQRDRARRRRRSPTMELGRLDEETTANIGMIDGGTAPNVVAGRCRIEGEARSARRRARGRGDRARWSTPARGPRASTAATSTSTSTRYSAATGSSRLAAAGGRRGRRWSAAASSRARWRPAAAATPTRCVAAGFDALLLANGTEANHTPEESVAARSARARCSTSARRSSTEPGGADVLKLRRGTVVVDADPLEGRGRRRASAGPGPTGAWSATVRGRRRGDRQHRRARPRPRLGRLRRRPRQPDPRARRRRGAAGRPRDEAELQLAPAPGRSGRAARGCGRRGRRDAIPVLVLPLHGHLAPAAGRPRRSAGLRRRLRAGRRRRRCPAALARRRRAARARAPRRARHRSARYGGEHEAISLLGALARRRRTARLGGRDRRARARASSARRPATGTAAWRRSTRPTPRSRSGCRRCVSPRMSAGDPRPRHLGLSHHTRSVLELLLAAVEVPVPAARRDVAARCGGAGRASGRHAAIATARSRPSRPRRLRGSGLPPRTMGR